MYIKNKFGTIVLPLSRFTTKDTKFNRKHILRNTFKNKPINKLFIKNKDQDITGSTIYVEKKGCVKANFKGSLRSTLRYGRFI